MSSWIERIEAIEADLANGTDGLGALKTLIDDIQIDLGDPSTRGNLQTLVAMMGNPDVAGKTLYGNIGDFVGQANLQTLLAALGIPDVSGKPLYTLLVADRLDHGSYGLNALKTLIEAISTATPIAATDAGVAQIVAATINLNQVAATYDLFTGTAQVVILESLNIKMPTGVPGGALTSISIQTDDVTAGVIINPTDGAVANLTSEADLGWTGTLYITVGTKIRLTIGDGAAAAGYVCNVTAKCRAVVSGGYLA